MTFYARVLQPEKWQMGYSESADGTKTYFYADCGDCHKKEPFIHGFVQDEKG